MGEPVDIGEDLRIVEFLRQQTKAAHLVDRFLAALDVLLLAFHDFAKADILDIAVFAPAVGSGFDVFVDPPEFGGPELQQIELGRLVLVGQGDRMLGEQGGLVLLDAAILDGAVQIMPLVFTDGSRVGSSAQFFAELFEILFEPLRPLLHPVETGVLGLVEIVPHRFDLELAEFELRGRVKEFEVGQIHGPFDRVKHLRRQIRPCGRLRARPGSNEKN